MKIFETLWPMSDLRRYMSEKIINHSPFDSITSRTLDEYYVVIRESGAVHVPENIDLTTPLVKYCAGEEPKHTLNIPLVSAAMQSVTGPDMVINLDRQGGTGFIYCSQPIEEEAAMVRAVKEVKAGRVKPITVTPDMGIDDVLRLVAEKGYNNYPVVDADNRFLGLLEGRNYMPGDEGKGVKVGDVFVQASELTVGKASWDLKHCNKVLREARRQSILPLLDDDGTLDSIVFKKDIKRYNELEGRETVDDDKRYLAVAAINTFDYRTRVPALVDAGVDILAFDSSNAFRGYQKEGIRWVVATYPHIPIIGGNVISGDGFRFLAEAGAHAVKVGMGSGSICITSEQKGVGRGIATALMDVVAARDRWRKETGVYIPVIADGGVYFSKQIAVAIADGADYVMMGKYFARFDESPTEVEKSGDLPVKPYWGEGAPRARAWMGQRYGQSTFPEGVETKIPFANSMHRPENLPRMIAQIKATMADMGCLSLADMRAYGMIEHISEAALEQGTAKDVLAGRK
ncbi:IMP dehydrogenase [Candidatus Woesearchaeota archaeon]|nr:IMP dehydrogenase [Candidatus Woesearchaeota archaeon]